MRCPEGGSERALLEMPKDEASSVSPTSMQILTFPACFQ